MNKSKDSSGFQNIWVSRKLGKNIGSSYFVICKIE